MNQRRIDRLGLIGASVGVARVTRMSLRPFVRATVTHGVFEENMRRFGEVLDQIAETHDFVSPDGYFEFCRSGEHVNDEKRPKLLVTFDDGLLSSFDFIVSQLTPRNIRTVVFVPTAVIGLNSEEQLEFALRTRFPGVGALREEQYRTIGQEQIRNLVTAGHTILPHSHTHARLSTLKSETELLDEIVHPRAIVERLTQRPAQAFALPYGGRDAVSAASFAHLRRTYDYCFTAIGGRTNARSDHFLLRRDSLEQSHEFALIEAKLNGVFDGYNSLKARSQRRRLGKP